MYSSYNDKNKIWAIFATVTKETSIAIVTAYVKLYSYD